MASARRARAAASASAGKREAIAAVMLDVAQCFFRRRALGRQTGFIAGWGGGAYGFLRSLAPADRDRLDPGAGLDAAEIGRTTEIIRQFGDEMKAR
jgi:hypothetical protein